MEYRIFGKCGVIEMSKMIPIKKAEAIAIDDIEINWEISQF